MQVLRCLVSVTDSDGVTRGDRECVVIVRRRGCGSRRLIGENRGPRSASQMLPDGAQEFPSFFLGLKGTVSYHDETGVKPKLNRPWKICNTRQTRPWKGGLAVDRFST
jgi:hypothetical protein